MPTSFASYDLDQNGTISPEEWQQFYGMDEGPATGQPFVNDGAGGPAVTPPGDPTAQTAPFNFDEFLAKVTSGNVTDDDMLAFSNWYMGQQMGQQAGQMDYQNRYLDYLNSQLGLNEQQLAQAQQEMSFQQGPYWDWYTTQYFPHQQERDKMDYELSRYNLDTQKALGEIEQGKAKDYALAQMYNTEQSKYGADAARYQYLQMTNGQLPPDQNGRPVRQEPRTARAVLGAY